MHLQTIVSSEIQMAVYMKGKYMKERSKALESYKMKKKDMKAIGTKIIKMEKVLYM